MNTSGAGGGQGSTESMETESIVMKPLKTAFNSEHSTAQQGDNGRYSPSQALVRALKWILVHVDANRTGDGAIN